MKWPSAAIDYVRDTMISGQIQERVILTYMKDTNLYLGVKCASQRGNITRSHIQLPPRCLGNWSLMAN